jgi:two-component system chemotaxis response regulator CheB
MGVLSEITCPECGGALWEHDERGILRFRCHVGHAFSPESLEASQADALEGALWAALRGLQERAQLLRRLSRRVGGRERLDQQAATVDEHSRILRSLLQSFGGASHRAGEQPRSES